MQEKEEIQKKNSRDKIEEQKEDQGKRSRSRSRSKSVKKEERTSEIDQKNICSFPKDEKQIIKIIFWNVAGLRALLQKKDLYNLIQEENPDIICFNETKMEEELIEKMNLKKMFNENIIIFPFGIVVLKKKDIRVQLY